MQTEKTKETPKPVNPPVTEVKEVRKIVESVNEPDCTLEDLDSYIDAFELTSRQGGTATESLVNALRTIRKLL